LILEYCFVSIYNAANFVVAYKKFLCDFIFCEITLSCKNNFSAGYNSPQI